MKLNKWERLSAYYIMLAEANVLEYDAEVCSKMSFDNNYRSGLCKLIKYISGKVVVLSDLSELYGKSPSWFQQAPYWYRTDDWTKRIQLLKSCIQELEQQINPSNQK